MKYQDSTVSHDRNIQEDIATVLRRKSYIKMGKSFALIAGAMLFLSACSHIEQSQYQAMDQYRAVIAQEQGWDEATREEIFLDQIWYNPALWQRTDGKTATEGELEKAFLGCLTGAKSVEEGISSNIGGKDPIQIIHARATVELCMVSKGYQPINKNRALICESDYYDVLPVCYFSRDLVRNYRD